VTSTPSSSAIVIGNAASDGDGDGLVVPGEPAVVPTGADVAAVVPPGDFEQAPATRAATRSAARTGGARNLFMERLLSREGTRAPRLPRQVS
jgi:hypothetical protein